MQDHDARQTFRSVRREVREVDIVHVALDYGDGVVANVLAAADISSVTVDLMLVMVCAKDGKEKVDLR